MFNKASYENNQQYSTTVPIKESSLLAAIAKQPVSHTPVWLMRQAGRYLPEYLAIRKRAGSFLNLCHNPDWVTEVTLQPLRRFPLDAAILFSDILILPEAMGLPLEIIEKRGPVFAEPVRNERTIHSLPIIDPSDQLDFVLSSIQLIQESLPHNTPLIGFAGSPWTVGCYVVEGQLSKGFRYIKSMMYSNPALLHQLLHTLTQNTISYLQAQIKAGVDVVMLFDSWAGALSPVCFQQFSLKYLQQIVVALKNYAPHIPVILFCKDKGSQLESIADTGCDVVGVDWTINLSTVKQRIGSQVSIQGNLDPCVLFAEPEVIKRSVRCILEELDVTTGHVFNLGHGILPETPIESVHCLVETVRDYSQSLQRQG